MMGAKRVRNHRQGQASSRRETKPVFSYNTTVQLSGNGDRKSKLRLLFHDAVKGPLGRDILV